MKDDEYNDDEYNDDEFGDDGYFDDEAWDLVEGKLDEISQQIDYLDFAYMVWEDYREMKEHILPTELSRDRLIEMLKFFVGEEEYEHAAIVRDKLKSTTVNK